MTTNGRKQPINRDEVIRLSTYHAAVYGWYDTSVKAQQNGDLTISVMDMQHIEKLQPEITHKFYVMINACGFIVSRRVDGTYDVQPHDQIGNQSQERELRLAVMDHALFYLTDESYRIEPDPVKAAEERDRAIADLLEGIEPDEERDGGRIVHAVIKDVSPSIMIAPGDQDSPAPIAVRQWRVTFGDNAECEVGFFGYDMEEGTPFLVPVEVDPDLEDLDDEEPEA